MSVRTSLHCLTAYRLTQQCYYSPSKSLGLDRNRTGHTFISFNAHKTIIILSPGRFHPPDKKKSVDTTFLFIVEAKERYRNAISVVTKYTITFYIIFFIIIKDSNKCLMLTYINHIMIMMSIQCGMPWHDMAWIDVLCVYAIGFSAMNIWWWPPTIFMYNFEAYLRISKSSYDHDSPVRWWYVP